MNTSYTRPYLRSGRFGYHPDGGEIGNSAINFTELCSPNAPLPPVPRKCPPSGPRARRRRAHGGAAARISPASTFLVGLAELDVDDDSFWSTFQVGGVEGDEFAAPQSACEAGQQQCPVAMACHRVR